MIQLSNITAQTLNPGQALSLSQVFKSKRGCECFNSQSPTSVKLCNNGVYDVTFSGNIAGAAGVPLQIAMALGGQPLIDTAMNSVSAAANNLNNVSTEKLLSICCCDLDRLSIINSGTNPVTIAPNSALVIKKLS